MHFDLMRDRQKTMPTVDRSVDGLRVWHCGYRTLKPVGELHQLRTLVIATLPDDSFAFLSALRSLRYLRILHLPRITDLAPLAELQQLKSLSLSTLPSWDSSSRVTEVESLDPLGTLAALEYLELFGVVGRTRSLAALERCRSLTSARFSKYPKEEVDRFYAATKVSDGHVPEPDAG
ncbi:MAG: hypothetical protein NTY53_18285 [Kiritimatiellaeota bacterium]|nr:hypothetical protein [Kiritimatiellota bacterium]